MIEKKSWQEFRDCSLLWYINRMLHLFGWAIVYELDELGNILSVYPARVKFRGFDNKIEEDGFRGLTQYLHKNSEELIDEVTND